AQLMDNPQLQFFVNVFDDLDRNGDGKQKSTRLNSSHDQISYAVFCLKKKKRSYRSTCRGTWQTKYTASHAPQSRSTSTKSTSSMREAVLSYPARILNSLRTIVMTIPRQIRSALLLP